MNRPSNPKVAFPEPVCSPHPSFLILNRYSLNNSSALAYLREIGLPDYTELFGVGMADVTTITGAILSPEEIQTIRKVDARLEEFTKAFEMTCSLQSNPRKALRQSLGEDPRPLSEAQMRDAFAWEKNIPAAKSIAKRLRKDFFLKECLPVMKMVSERACRQLDSVIRLRVPHELNIYTEQKERFFKKDSDFRFHASGEMRGLINRYLFMSGLDFQNYHYGGGSLKSQLKDFYSLK